MRRPIAAESSLAQGDRPSNAAARSQNQAASGTSSATSSSDRRQRLRYADYDASTDRTPAESPVPFLSLAGDSLPVSPHGWARDHSPVETRAMAAEDTIVSQANSRKRSAQSAENEADDLCHHRQSGVRAAQAEENSKISGEDESEQGDEEDPRGPEVQLSEAEIAQLRAARVAETDARLRHLAQELCPLIDRFGRVLTDIAPHLWEMGGIDAAAPASPPSGAPAGGAAANEANAENAFEASLLALLRARYALL